jgi:hypothetical protein
MAGLLPASPAAARRELEVRERAGAESYDRGHTDARPGSSRPLTPTAPNARPAGSADPAIRTLARKIGTDSILLPTSVRITRTMDDEGELATHIGFDHLTFSIEDALRLNVLSLDGRFN